MKNDIAKDRHIIDTPLNRPKKTRRTTEPILLF